MKYLDDNEDLERYAPEVRAFFDFSEDDEDGEEYSETVIDLRSHLTPEERAYEEENDRRIAALQARFTCDDDEPDDWEEDEDEDAPSEKMKFLSADEEQ